MSLVGTSSFTVGNYFHTAALIISINVFVIFQVFLFVELSKE